MSVMRCDKHDRHWDSDVGEQCPQCASEPQAEPPADALPTVWVVLDKDAYPQGVAQTSDFAQELVADENLEHAPNGPHRAVEYAPADRIGAATERIKGLERNDESISDMLARHDKEVREAIRRVHDRMIGAEAKRDAVESQMQTFNAVVQERDAKIVTATDRAERAESALAAANEREEGLRVALEDIAKESAYGLNSSLTNIRSIARAALARKESDE